MSNPTRPDFAQKLLSDLKMRKERMVATPASGRNSGNMPSSDSSRSTRRSHKSSTEMRSLAKSTSNTTNTAKMQRASSGSQSSRMKADSSLSMIVPYGGGRGSKQPVDLSMTLSYALDDNGKLKQMNLTGSNAVIGFLRQISRKRMDFPNQHSQIQWPSSAQFPTLTNLRIDEVSKGAQRLNQILKNFYNGVNSGGCSVDIGKELLKGTMELEESLRMLVSLQETSEFMAAPQRKSKVKLLEMGDDEEEDDKAVKKRVEKPVFSFDKRAKNEKAVMPITYPKKNSNVVAKLMGLEEVPRKGGERNNAQTMTFGLSRSGFGDEDAWDPTTSSKIVILASEKKESDERKPGWSQREREQIMTHMMQLNRKDNGGVKKPPLKNEGQKRSVSKAPERRVGQEKSVRDGRLQQPKTPQRVDTQGKSGKKGLSKAPARRTEAAIETSTPKDIHEVKDEKGYREKVLQEVTFESSVSTKDVISEKLKLKQDQEETKPQARKVVNKMAKSGPNQKANEVMAKLAKPASKPSRAMKQQATILQGLKHRKPNKQHMEIHKATDNELRICQDLENIPQILNNQDVNLKLDQPLMQGKDAESRPQTNEFVQDSDNQEKVIFAKLDTQKPLTDDEMYLKQILITSQVFLNTAEALFKLDIPIGILNGGDIECQQEKESKQVIDCAYEMLKMKGKRRELVFYPCKNARISKIKMTSLDDLVRQLHKDFESLKSYGKTVNSEFDQVEYLLKMMERDIHHKDMDVNCMWDMGWSERVFAYIEMDEVIRDVEKCMLNELLDDVLEGFMKASMSIACV